MKSIDLKVPVPEIYGSHPTRGAWIEMRATAHGYCT